MTSAADTSWLQDSIDKVAPVDKRDWITALSTLIDEMSAAQAALTEKAPLTHTHATADVADLDAALADRVQRDKGQASNLLLKGSTQHAAGASTLESGKLTLDFTDGSVFYHTLTANVTSIVLENVPSVQGATSFKLVLQQDGTGSRTVAFPSSWKAAGGSVTAPSSTADDISLYEVWTYDNGATYSVERQQVGIAGTAAPTYNGDLAYGGLWYGNNFGGAPAIGNKTINWTGSNFNIAAATIPIYKTGSITHIRVNNRIEQNGGGTGYGRGGCVAWLEMRKALADGKPDMTTSGLLGQTATYDPASDSDHPKRAWQSSISVTAGTKVCIVWRNSTQNSDLFYSANFLVNDKPITPRSGPAWGDCKVWTSSNNGSSWVEAKRGGDTEPSRGMYVFWGDLFYSGGIVHGNPYRFANASATTYIPLIDGANYYVRQKFQMRASGDFAAKSVWLRYFSEADNPEFCIILTGPSLLECKSIPASLVTKMTSGDSTVAKLLGSPRGNPNAGTAAAIEWFKVPFSTTRTLVAGSQYTLEIRAGSIWVWNGTAWKSDNNGAAAVFKGRVATTGDLPSSGNTTGDTYVVGGDGAKGRICGTLNGKREGVYESIEGFDGASSVTEGQFTTNAGSSWEKVTASNGTGFSYDFPVLFGAV